MQYNTIQYNTIQYNTIQCNAIQYNTIQYNTILLNTINLSNLSICPFRDLKPENLLLTSEDDDANIKIADFGFAVECSDSSLTTRCGTPGKIFPPFPYHICYVLASCLVLWYFIHIHLDYSNIDDYWKHY